MRLAPSRWLPLLTRADGLRSINLGMCRGQGSVVLPDERLLFASLQGVVSVIPNRIPVPTYGPTPVISELQADNGGSLSLLEGVDARWQPALTRRPVQYTNLARPGAVPLPAPIELGERVGCAGDVVCGGDPAAVLGDALVPRGFAAKRKPKGRRNQVRASKPSFWRR